MSNCSANNQLLNAIRIGDIDLVRRIVDSGVQPFRQKNLLMSNESPLVLATQTRLLPLVPLLLDLGAPVDEFGEAGYTALQVACNNSSLDMAKLLLKYGANVAVYKHHPTAVAFAAFSGNDALVRLILDNGGNPEEVWIGGVTSALRLRIEVLRELVAFSNRVPDYVVRLLAVENKN
ncbi:MAG: hypothetical protein HOO92_06405 [Methylococcaceae bacterium]|nr:hypothetical protein [Methylococcaceae bacterium]